MKNALQRGFTLIELLVVIAIIAILAAVVIGSLADVRSGGQDASIQQSMSSLRNQAEVHYNTNNFTYAGVCTDARITDLLVATMNVVGHSAATASSISGSAATNNANTATSRVAACASDSSNFMMKTPLAAGGDYDEFWCIDSDGNSRAVSTGAVTATGSCS